MEDYLEYYNNLIRVDTTSMLHYYMTAKLEYGTNTIKLKGEYIAGPFITYIFRTSLPQVDSRFTNIEMDLGKCDIFIYDDNPSIEDKTFYGREYRYIKTDKADTMEHLFESFNEPQYQIGYDIKSKEFYLTQSAYEFIYD